MIALESQVLSCPAALRAGLPDLIDHAGTPTFEIRLFELLQQVVPCDHLTVFLSGPDAVPRIALASDRASGRSAERTAARYVERHWRHDPMLPLAANDTGTCPLAVRVVAAELESDFRDECYTAIGLTERLTLASRRDGELLRLSLYTGEGFSDAGAAQVAGAADLLLAVTARHVASHFAARRQPSFKEARIRVSRAVPQLPPREAEVCAGIFIGMSTEAMALELAISTETVRTYRKRAYGRLRISAQNELIRLVAG